jgi:hypothetical protein
MLRVDIKGDTVLLEGASDQESLSLVDASKLMGDLATAMQLIAESRTPRKSMSWPVWRRPGPGEGYAILPDGQRLRVVATPQGWVGYIGETPVNDKFPTGRKIDAQKLVVMELTK